MSHDDKMTEEKILVLCREDPDLFLDIHSSFMTIMNEMMTKLHQLGAYEEFKQELQEKSQFCSEILSLIIESKPESIKEGWE